jgi:hypothetical protein
MYLKEIGFEGVDCIQLDCDGRPEVGSCENSKEILAIIKGRKSHLMNDFQIQRTLLHGFTYKY